MYAKVWYDGPGKLPSLCALVVQWDLFLSAVSGLSGDFLDLWAHRHAHPHAETRRLEWAFVMTLMPDQRWRVWVMPSSILVRI